GGFYLASLGGAGGKPPRDCIKKGGIVGNSQLGMGGVWRGEGGEFPGLLLIDDKGKDFFPEIYFGGNLGESRASGPPLVPSPIAGDLVSLVSVRCTRSEHATPRMTAQSVYAKLATGSLVRITIMACIKVADMAYGRLKAPDLDLMEEFLTRFGMVRSERTA